MQSWGECQLLESLRRGQVRAQCEGKSVVMLQLHTRLGVTQVSWYTVLKKQPWGSKVLVGQRRKRLRETWIELKEKSVWDTEGNPSWRGMRVTRWGGKVLSPCHTKCGPQASSSHTREPYYKCNVSGSDTESGSCKAVRLTCLHRTV